VSCAVRTAELPDPGHAVHYTGADDSAQKRGGAGMSTNKNAAVLIAAMSITTILLRFLPFLVFKKETPPYISYLGKVLPPAIIGMLVIYCLKDFTPTVSPYGIPELIAAACVVILQVWKRNSLISILTGTVIYMILIQMVF
jgi:branched-subunit amino acid transport protein AzlD